MKTLYVGLLLGCAVCSGAASHESPAARPGSSGEPLVTYCDLVRSPERYSGQTVRVVGVYRYGFEWSELYSLQCADAGSTWVEWTGGSQCPGLPKAKTLRFPDSGATVGLIVRGRLQGPGRFGHLDGFDFQLDVDCTEHMELLDKRSYRPGALTPDIRRKIEKFEKRFAAPRGG